MEDERPRRYTILVKDNNDRIVEKHHMRSLDEADDRVRELLIEFSKRSPREYLWVKTIPTDLIEREL
jgi:hypothetical protein